ncbi:late competence development ComFB family protein [uncultured Oscillibacter sp.]|uniref:late competence development ComFB family protein n=1 Tax=uncultured Oscillibacter sp. TaxID=876091 RepID=UPI0025FFBA6B|nr:late competence development ComFB family protein [uncultured Oscillibacter sp.]
MASSRKGTNKTAHVLNMIADRGNAADAPAFSAPAAAPETPPAPPVSAAAVVPAAAAFQPVVEVEHIPEDLSDQVRDALSEELAMESEDGFSVFQPQTIQPPPAEPLGAQASQPRPTPAAAPAAQTAAPAPQPAAVASSAAPAAAPVSPAQAAPSGGAQTEAAQGDGGNEYTYINVMQSLVNEKAPEFARLMGVCPCSRCLADVEALALSHLEPKYIVARKNQRFPFSAYENRYNAAVTSQIIAACQLVIQKPRH